MQIPTNEGKLRLKHLNTVPSGGWRYEQPETGEVIRSENYVHLIRDVIVHRQRNNIPVATVEDDIHTYLCNVLGPDWCQYKMKSTTQYATEKKYTIYDVQDFVSAVTQTIKSGGVVSQQEAERRARICAQCPLNKTIAGCYGCKGIANAVMSLIGARAHGQEGKLRQCGGCGCFLDAKVWVPLDAQPRHPDHSYPQHCWMHDQPAE